MLLYYTLIVMAASAIAIPLAVEKSSNSSIDSRQVTVPTYVTFQHNQYALVGDGFPHQNFLWKQVSGSVDCTGNPASSVQIIKGQEVSYSAGISLAYGFFSGNFDVTTSFSTGESKEIGCQTDSDGNQGHKGSLCAFERVQLTAYTINPQTCSTYSYSSRVDCVDTGPAAVIFAPNKQQGSCFKSSFQLGLPCKAMGEEHYIKAGPPGGPQTVGSLQCDFKAW